MINNFKVPWRKFRYIFLYSYCFIRAATPRKIINLLLNFYEFKKLKPYLKSYPAQIVIDITNICNLQCPLCPTGIGQLDRSKGKMDRGYFADILNQIMTKTMAVHLYNWGEPLLLKDFSDYCRIAKKRGFVVSASSNLNISIDESRAEDIIQSGLDRLIISFDGLTQNTYGMYRKNGDLNLVVNNIKLLVATKKKLHAKYPLLILQMVRHKDNTADALFLGSAARKLGADYHSIIDILLPFGENYKTAKIDDWISSDRLSEGVGIFDIPRRELGFPCFHLWKIPVINIDGSLSPCCYVYSKKDDFGTISYSNFEEIWNSRNYQLARELFLDKESTPVMPCCHCSVYRKYKSRF
jgi:MoaA/NifB/PqqE/SkfB family radical SAM enzyme